MKYNQMTPLKVLLINCPNRITRPPEFFPYGLALLSSVLKKKNIITKIYDLNLYRNINEFYNFLKSNSVWDIVGLSGIITTYSIQKKLACIIRELLPNALIVSGGGLASSVPKLLLKNTSIEIACIGEGEKTLLELVVQWYKDRDISQIRGIFWKKRKTNEIIKNNIRDPISNLDEIPFPDWEGANFKKYMENYSCFYNKGFKSRKLMKRRGDSTTSRGCSYNCNFCANVFRRQIIRTRSIQNVIEEIKFLKRKYNIDSIDFLDEHFCYSRDYVIKLCENMLKEKLKIVWGTATRVDHVDKELLKIMKKAGCIFILYGFESGSQKILNNMNKKITIEQAWETFKITEEIGINAMGNLIIGYPGENKETLYESLNFQKKRYNFLLNKFINDGMDDEEIKEELRRRFETVSFVIPFPGSFLYENFKEKIGDLESFMKKISLNDANYLVVNLSELSNVELLGYQQILSNTKYWNLI